ncbi:hypothetical protein EGW08_001072 [Elysia chlorotica]|uniref:Uncharacterized protein n=1 Tax=Elysia chlorotica TaxID=188477 RepID=A0A433UBF4_ELYCH|nr:hypothetical protein EGW08_001072 [Elysia chlorotica]
MGQLLSARIFSIVREAAGGTFEVEEEEEEDTTATRDDNSHASGSERASSSFEGCHTPASKRRDIDTDLDTARVHQLRKGFVEVGFGDNVYQKGSPRIDTARDGNKTWGARNADRSTADDGCNCFRRKSGGQTQRGRQFACFVDHGGSESFCHHANTGSNKRNDLSVHKCPSSAANSAAKKDRLEFWDAKNASTNVCAQHAIKDHGVNNTNNKPGKATSTAKCEVSESSPAFSVHWCEVGSVKDGYRNNNTFAMGVHRNQGDAEVESDSPCGCPKLRTLVCLPSCLDSCWSGHGRGSCCCCCERPSRGDIECGIGNDGATSAYGNGNTDTNCSSPPRSRCINRCCGKLRCAMERAMCCYNRDTFVNRSTPGEERMRPDSVVIVDILGGLSASTADKNRLSVCGGSGGGGDGNGHSIRSGSAGFVQSLDISRAGSKPKPVVVVEQPRSSAAPQDQCE